MKVLNDPLTSVYMPVGSFFRSDLSTTFDPHLSFFVLQQVSGSD